MISSNKENYLKTIFELSTDQQKITNKKIADILQVSAPSVTEMLANLTKSGLVEHSPYNEITLTPAGLTLAMDMVKKHRLWETFLHADLGYSIEEVHQAADKLEHSTDDILAERLNKYLGYPKKCPHGGGIPENTEFEIDKEVVTLIAAPKNQVLEIIRVIDNHEFLMYFAELGLNIGDQLKVLRQLPFDGPLEIELSTGQKIEISTKAASYIFVK